MEYWFRKDREMFVENVENILKLHRKDTVITYGTKTSFKSSRHKENNSFNSNNCSNEKMVSFKRETMMHLVGSHQFIFFIYLPM